jgi:proteasome beta subunit
VLALRALDTAAETDTATGGVDRRGRVYPVVKIVSGEGITTLTDEELANTFKAEVR